MKSKVLDRSGSVLLEGVIALLILCLTLASVMLMAGMVIRGHTKSEADYTEAFALNSLRDQIAEKIDDLSDHSPAAIASAVGSIVATQKGWSFQILSYEQGLVTLLLLYETDGGKHEYQVQICAVS